MWNIHRYIVELHIKVKMDFLLFCLNSVASFLFGQEKETQRGTTESVMYRKPWHVQYKTSKQTFSNFFKMFTHIYILQTIVTSFYFRYQKLSMIMCEIVKNGFDSCKEHSKYSVYTCIYDPLMISFNKITDYLINNVIVLKQETKFLVHSYK